jgi:hypothetical protein
MRTFFGELKNNESTQNLSHQLLYDEGLIEDEI